FRLAEAASSVAPPRYQEVKARRRSCRPGGRKRHTIPAQSCQERAMAAPGDSTPDLAAGVPASSLSKNGTLLGRVGDDDVVLARAGDRIFAVGAHCTHYHGPLAEGLVVGETVRCPLHHACFSLETGEALRAPALDPIACWRVEQRGETVFVREKLAQPRRSRPAASESPRAPSSIVIAGGGGAGLAAADMLRREGYGGPITMISADQ